MFLETNADENKTAYEDPRPKFPPQTKVSSYLRIMSFSSHVAHVDVKRGRTDLGNCLAGRCKDVRFKAELLFESFLLFDIRILCLFAPSASS